MTIGSQVSRVELLSALTGLTHDIFVGRVVNNVRRESKTAMMFQDAQAGQDYKLVGQNMVFAIDLRFKTGALATDGKLPDYVAMDAVQGKVTPVRRYARLAIDNFVEKAASGEGAYEDIGDRIFNQLWDQWASMEIRHSVGDSTGLVCKCSSRTSSTVWVAKDGYGRASTNPLSNLSEGSIISWYDVSAVGVGGAGAVTSTGLNYSTNAVTMDSASTWEPSAQLAADDLIYFATTSNSTTDYFKQEKNLAPNGAGTILDPNGSSTQVFNISQTTYQRWKPYRKTSSTFDHMEVTEFWLQLGAKRGFEVSPSTDKVICHPAPVAQLARSLMGLQQQVYTGEGLKGGYTTVTVAGHPIIQDQFWYQDVLGTFCTDKLFRIPLGGDADFWGEDGSMWSRTADYDGKDAFVVDYLNFFSNHRGSHGCLSTIVTADITDSDYDAVPNY